MAAEFGKPPAAHSSALGLVYPLPLLVLFVLAFVALEIWYLERLAIQVGPEPPPAPSPAVNQHGSWSPQTTPRDESSRQAGMTSR